MNYTSNAFIMASAFNLHPEEGIARKHYAILAVKNIHTFFWKASSWNRCQQFYRIIISMFY